MILTDNFDHSRICSVLLRMTQKTCHSTAETLIFMTMQKLRSCTHNNIPNLDYLFLIHLVCLKYTIICRFKS